MVSSNFNRVLLTLLFLIHLSLTSFAWAKTQVEELTEAAESGNAGAQLQLAWMYKSGDFVKLSDGTSVSKDSLKALEWFKRAAKSADESAQQIAAFEIGGLYTGGNTIPVDLVQATHWLTISSDISIPNEPRSIELRADAFNILGQIYLEECLWIDLSGPICATQKSLPLKDNGTAARFFEESVQLGNGDARLYLAMMYKLGKGVPQNFAKAHELFLAIADVGNESYAGNDNLFVALGKLNNEMGKPIEALMWFTLGAAENDKEAVLLRDKARGLLTPRDVAMAQQMAEDWLHDHR